MLFNSYDFVFLFVPISFALFLISNALRPSLNGIVLLAVSLLFYAYWNPPFVLLLLASIVGNYWIGQYVSRLPMLWLGVSLNLALLFWFKYAQFTLGLFVSPEGARSILGDIILPLGISFYTFHQISYLVDVRKGSAARPNLSTYAAYVVLFRS